MKEPAQILVIAAVLISFPMCGRSVSTDKTHRQDENYSFVIDKSSIVPGNRVSESGIHDIKSHSGYFDVRISGYKGELFIGISEGKFYGTIKFYNWGNGVPQPLTDLRVNEGKVYFKRVINTKEALIKYGGTDFFEQEYYGIFTSDRKIIKGYYRYVGTQDNWEAVKK